MTEVDDDPDAMANLRAMFKKKGQDGGTGPRRKREQQVKATVSKRSLRATGRTEVFSFRCRKDILDQVKRVTSEEGLSIAEWMEKIIESALEMEADANA